ncbi:WDTC1 [Cordylochernes scorpioides]|uniref:WDTC1 n=1 Tax=Cordylochernes scorpioides TaxID=51811 RepID=A0ABY6KP70_9ARAC|nr:WDTC1 [Cordylochernes scorpioides]
MLILLASGSDDVQIILWDPFQYRQLHTIQSGHQGNIFSVKFLPLTNDKTLVSGAADCRLRVHDVQATDTTMVCSCHTGRVKRIAVAPNTPFMFWSAAEDGFIMEFDLRTPHQCSNVCHNVLINLSQHLGRGSEAKCLAINPLRTEMLAVGANDPYVRLYDRRMIHTSKIREKKFSQVEMFQFPFDISSRPIWDQWSPTSIEYDQEDQIPSKSAQYFVAGAGHLATTTMCAGHLPAKHQDYKKKYRALASTYITFSPDGNELLANLGGEQIYLFDLVNPPHVTAALSLNSPAPPDTNPYSYEKNLPPFVEALKQKANEYFQHKRYHEAIMLYNQAITMCPSGTVLYGNRAAALMKRSWDGDLYSALKDCKRSLQLDSEYFKAHFRLIRCLFELNWTEQAMEGLQVGQGSHATSAIKEACCDTAEKQQTAAGPEQVQVSFSHLCQCCFVKWRPDLSPVDYIKALEEKLGKSSVFQMMKMSGQVLVGLASVNMAERLVEEGLTIGITILKAFPYKKRAEKIAIGNLPIAIRDEDVVAALRPYCRVVSLNHEVVTSGGYTWTTGSREVFVLLNEGLKLHQLPAKLVIVSKGESTPAYITYGIECGKCHRKGHRRASCPLKAHESRPAHLQDTQSGPESPSSQPMTSTNSAARGSDTIQKTPLVLSSPAAANCFVPPQMIPSAEPFVSVPSLPGPSSTTAVPTEVSSKETHSKNAPTIQSTIPKLQEKQPLQTTLQKVEELFESLNANTILEPLYENFYREEIKDAVGPPSNREDILEYLTPEQRSALKLFLDMAIAHVGEKSDLRGMLFDFRTECDIIPDDPQWDSIVPVWQLFKSKFPKLYTSGQCQDLERDIKAALAQEARNKGNSTQSLAQTLSDKEKVWRRDAFDHDKRFLGHCNTTTDIKEANFFGR